MLVDWRDDIPEDTLPMWNIEEDIPELPPTPDAVKTTQEKILKKINPLGFNSIEKFAAYYGFTTEQEILYHLNIK